MSKGAVHFIPMQKKSIFRIIFITCILILSISVLSVLGYYEFQDAEYIQVDGPTDGLRILFIGNSYIYENDLPKIFSDLARAGGHQVSAAMLVRGGWTLSHHYHNIAPQIIQQGSWDTVVLQEQSSIPANAFMQKYQMYPAIKKLNTEVENAGAQTILFMTWGHRDGASILGSHDYEEMQAKINDGYNFIGRELGIVVSPVGKAWRIALDKDPKIVLWGEDGSHPDKNGSYLSACVFYSVIFNESPSGLSYFAGLSEEEAIFLQQVAEESVFD